MQAERIIIRREVRRGHVRTLREAHPVVAQMVFQEIMVRVRAAATRDPPFLRMDQLHRAVVIFDAVDIVPRLPEDTVHAPQLPARAVIRVRHIPRNRRHALRKVQVIVRDPRDVVARATAVHPRLHIPVGIVTVSGSPRQLYAQ